MSRTDQTAVRGLAQNGCEVPGHRGPAGTGRPDDRDDKPGTAWWSEKVKRIDASDVFAAALVTLLGAVALVWSG